MLTVRCVFFCFLFFSLPFIRLIIVDHLGPRVNFWSRWITVNQWLIKNQHISAYCWSRKTYWLQEDFYVLHQISKKKWRNMRNFNSEFSLTELMDVSHYCACVESYFKKLPWSPCPRQYSCLQFPLNPFVTCVSQVFSCRHLLCSVRLIWLKMWVEMVFHANVVYFHLNVCR